MIFAFVFVILFSVLNSTLILSEYNHKTILIMFTYPVDRRKLILSKLILITLFIAVSLFAGYVLCGSFIISMHHWFHWIEEDFQISVLQNWLLRAVSTTIVFCNLGLWTFVVGMWKKSVPMAIVSSVLFINLRQIVVASAETCRENIWFVFMAILITVITIWYTLMHKIENLD